jgi:hypothetical protein
MSDGGRTHLDIARPTVKVQMKILNLAVICELVLHVFLCRLFMNAGDKDDPPFDRCRRE